MEKRIFAKTLEMDSTTIIYENGEVVTSPADYAEANGLFDKTKDSVNQSGRFKVFQGGGTHFIPYRQTSCRRYEPVFETHYGLIRETKEDLIFIIRLPKNMGKKALCAKHFEVTKIIREFLKTFKW